MYLRKKKSIKFLQNDEQSRGTVCFRVLRKTSQISRNPEAALSAMFVANITDLFDLSLYWASIV